ncbi:aminoglycoside phosphotransferase family protein [Streptomyces hirsutus]
MSPEDFDPAVAALLSAVAVAPADMVECAPLSGGTYNSLLRVVLRDGRRWIVKRPPSPRSGSTLRYEHDLLRGAGLAYYTAVRDLPGVPVPRLVHVETSAEPPVVSGLCHDRMPRRPVALGGRVPDAR